jgi:hypothetical protein
VGRDAPYIVANDRDPDDELLPPPSAGAAIFLA